MSEHEFRRVENHFIRLNEREKINASEFELLTATAFMLFNEKQVDVGIIEVGMGGKLDATNILNNQVVSIISKIARDHQAFLGNTLEEIALHKAGILRPNTPYIVNPMNDLGVQKVIDDYAQEVGAGPRIWPDSKALIRTVFESQAFHDFADELLPFQRDNAVLALLAYTQVLKSFDLNPDWRRAVNMLAKIKSKRTLPGRQHLVKVPRVFGCTETPVILIDGAHNEDAAETLKEYVQERIRSDPGNSHFDESRPHEPRPIMWVIAMTEGKDPRRILRKLLRPGDNIITTSFGPVDGMPWIKSADPHVILSAAQEVRPGIVGLSIPERGAYRALCAAKHLSQHVSPDARFVLTGSLYFVGDFFREDRAEKNRTKVGQFSTIDTTNREEQYRIEKFLGKISTSLSDYSPPEFTFPLQRPVGPARQRSLSVSDALKYICERDALDGSEDVADPDRDIPSTALHSSHPRVEPVYIRKQYAKTYEQTKLETRKRRNSASTVAKY